MNKKLTINVGRSMAFYKTEQKYVYFIWDDNSIAGIKQ